MGEEAFGAGQRPDLVAVGPQSLDPGLLGRPFRAQHVADRRLNQALYIRARRVVRAELGAVGGRQRLFEQRAEDGGLDILPLMLGRVDQAVEIGRGQGKDAAVREQPAVEVPHLRLGHPAPSVRQGGQAHLGPQVVQPAPQLAVVDHARRVGRIIDSAAGQEIPEPIGREQADILGEHAKQHPHEEQRRLLDQLRAEARIGLVPALKVKLAFLLQVLADLRELGRDLARDFGGAEAGIDQVRRGPDRPKQLGGREIDPGQLRVAREIAERDAIASFVREEPISPTVADVVEVKLERPAHVAHDQEGNGRMIARQ